MPTMQADFINEQQINTLLTEARQADKAQARSIIDRASQAKGLTPYECAILLHIEDKELLEEIYRVARQIKENIYGRRLVLFAPLYISNHCINNCVYCGYRRDNRFTRRRLTTEELQEEVILLEELGHKRLALEAGEDPQNCTIDYVLDSIKTIYAVKEANGSIRRVNVNIAATTVENYRLLKEAGIGTYILFQETYHRQTYAAMHPSGPKHDYDYHTTAMDRAMQGGIDDVGLGVLFGLYDYKYEVLAMLLHALHLEESFGVGPHTLSVPRLRPAQGVNYDNFPYLVDDAAFKKIIAVLRLAVPYTGMILSTREPAEFRDELLTVGISQISAGSCTGVGGYQQEHQRKSTGSCACASGASGSNVKGSGNYGSSASKSLSDGSATSSINSSNGNSSSISDNGNGRDNANNEAPQFQIEDHRSPDEMLRSVCLSGYIPSFCTACYRSGRTGDRFMPLAKSGQIQNVCQPNAILTFKEYLMDYASPETRAVGEKTIQTHLAEITNIKTRRLTEERLKLIEQGQRDLYF
ncbi:[FeFe] hydrogenase H-cluster radical SAM maturase HydG [Desulfoscipio gibsoniae]|uniref:Iron-only hydrogenase maturation rSAM protein HydG n=1 Tax=Desulfoscipio gibsoniae DSM 7213 TaxID=767817 RepID=R4KLF0_9FIRM|nr:[FeFe] hydrogenase H-cluster radical SAM maturase HydG [Desulfoscipio gibsoniae]AGL00466.1 iron-only hydrogenase maturation rSAM protein HydG [Desulfoscipio gibsoniae DSM 7213]